MKLIFPLTLAACLLAPLLAYSTATLSADVQEVFKRNANLTFLLGKELLKGYDGNIATTAAGAIHAIAELGLISTGDVQAYWRGEIGNINLSEYGKTFPTIESLLSGYPHLTIKERVWFSSSEVFNSDVASSIKQYFGGDTESVDFSNPAAAAEAINDWANTVLVTNEDIPTSTKALLVTVGVDYKNDWLCTPEDTTVNFTSQSGSQQTLPAMTITSQIDYVKSKDSQVLLMNTNKDDYRIMIGVPTDSSNEGFAAIFYNLVKQENLNDLLGSAVTTDVSVTIPTYEVEEVYSICDLYWKMNTDAAAEYENYAYPGLLENSNATLEIKQVSKVVFDKDTTSDGSDAKCSVNAAIDLEVDTPFYVALLYKNWVIGITTFKGNESK